MESIIVRAINFIGPVFTEVFGGDAQRKSKPPEVLSTDADDAWEALRTTYKTISALVANSNIFLATVVISHGAKSPLARFMQWGQKENKLLIKAKETAKSNREVYLGTTPLSKLVDFKGNEIRTLMSNWLESDIGEGPLTLVMALLLDDLFPKARQLIVELVLMGIASWDFRFAFKFSSLYLSWLNILVAHRMKFASVDRMLPRPSWGWTLAVWTANPFGAIYTSPCSNDTGTNGSVCAPMGHAHRDCLQQCCSSEARWDLTRRASKVSIRSYKRWPRQRLR